MEDKDQFDALMQLAEFRMARQRARRELEWKMSLSLWALLVGAIYTLKERPPERLLMLILVVILLGHSVVWVWHIWGANRRDTAAAFHYFRKAARLAGETPANIPSAPSNWLSAVQILMTAALSVAAYFLIGQPIGHPN